MSYRSKIVKSATIVALAFSDINSARAGETRRHSLIGELPFGEPNALH